MGGGGRVGGGGGPRGGHEVTAGGSEGGGTVLGHCGVERWPVKTGTDTDAGKINLSPVPTTIAHMVALQAPLNPSNTSRVAPTELTNYTINATLTGFKVEGDNDYHLVISDGTRTMIVELPNSGCVGSTSPLPAPISQPRPKLASLHSAQPTVQTVSVAVTATGVGVFDRL